MKHESLFLLTGPPEGFAGVSSCTQLLVKQKGPVPRTRPPPLSHEMLLFGTNTVTKEKRVNIIVLR